MRPMISLITVGLVALGSAQVIEERSIVRNPDGSQTHNARSSFSQASFSEESTGPDGTTIGRSIHRDTTGKITGNEWTAKNGQKLQTKPIDGSDIGARSTLGGFGGIGGLGGSGFGPQFGNTGFGNTGFGGPVGSGIGGVGTTGIGGVGTPGVGGIGTPGFGAGYGGFPSGGIDPGFTGMGSGFGGGFGNPGFGQRSYKHEVDPATGKQSYSFSESSGHSTSTHTG